MPNTITKRSQKEETSKIFAGDELRHAIEEEIKARRTHPNAKGEHDALHELMTSVFDSLAGSFRATMLALGIDGHIVQFGWQPIGDPDDAYEKLANLDHLIFDARFSSNL